MKPNSLFKGKYTKKALFVIAPVILCAIIVCVLVVSLNDRNAQTENGAGGENPDILSSERGDEEDMEKLYERINFENAPSTKTPLNEENLNKIDSAIDGLDDRVVQINDAFYYEEDNGTPLSEISGVVSMPNFSADDYGSSSGINIAPVSGYTTFYFVADKDYELYTVEIGRVYYAITIGRNYTGTSQNGNNTVLLSSNPVRYRNNESNLPIESNKLVVNTGDVVAFTVTDAVSNPAKIYGYKTEKKQKQKYSGYATKSGNQLDIKTDNAHYVFKRITNTSINIDTWRLYQGDLVSGDNTFNMWTDSDAEGVVKIYGEDDYLGGYHGDEIMTGISVFIDGEEIDMATDFLNRNFNNITIYVDSVLYHCNTSEVADTVAFDKHKMLIFEGNKVRIGNWFKARENLTMYGAPTALFQCHYKDSSGNEVATNYSVDSDYKCYKFSEAASVYPGTSKNMREAQIQTKYGFINFKLLKSSAQSYLGSVAHTFITNQNRIKIYFYAIGDGAQYALSSGEVISSEFEFEITR